MRRAAAERMSRSTSRPPGESGQLKSSPSSWRREAGTGSLVTRMDGSRCMDFIGTVARGSSRFQEMAKHVVVSDHATQFPALLTANAENIRRFQWNASGTALYVEAYDRGVRNLWRVTVEPRTLRWLTAERLTTSGSDEGASALSWDGTRLAFTITGGPTRLWAFALDTTGGRFADQGKPITEEGADVNDFDLSRDGRTVAHQMLRPGRQESELWTTDLDSGRSELIAKNAGGPRWSFDGARLAYYTWGTTAADPFRLLVRDSTRGDRTIARLSDGRLAFPLDWTPDDAAVLASWAASRSGTWALTLWPATRGVAEKPERILLSDARGSLWQAGSHPMVGGSASLSWTPTLQGGRRF